MSSHRRSPFITRMLVDLQEFALQMLIIALGVFLVLWFLIGCARQNRAVERIAEPTEGITGQTASDPERAALDRP